MNILVTGTRGQLGRSFIDVIHCGDNMVEGHENRFEYQGNTWIFTSHSVYSSPTLPFEPEVLELTSENEIVNFVLKNNINIIINCAAFTDVAAAEAIKKAMSEDLPVDDEVYHLNVNVPKWLANAAKMNGAVLIHFSTDYVFNGQTFIPYKEDRLKLPVNYYGKTKSLGEDEIVNSGCYHIIIRTQWLYSKYGDNFVTRMVSKLREKDAKIEVVDDQIGTLTNAYYLAVDITKLIANNTTEIRSLSQSGIYHYSPEGCCSWYDVACCIRGHLEGNDIITGEQTVIPVHTKRDTDVRRPYYTVLDSNKFFETFKIDRRHWWKDLLNDTLFDLTISRAFQKIKENKEK